MVREAGELHQLEPEDFYDQTHSFEHWFAAVEGYLSGVTNGHRPDLTEGELAPAERERLISALCNYCVGETAALEASSGLIRIAPNRHAKVFLATQVADEGRHLEVFIQRMKELGVADPEREIERRATRSIQEFKSQLLDLVAAEGWEPAIFAQNVVLEAMEFTAFDAHAEVADPVTADLLTRIVKDERRHIGFGENELGRRLQGDRALRARIGALKTRFDHLVLETFEDTLEQIGVPAAERPELGRSYLQVLSRIGFE